MVIESYTLFIYSNYVYLCIAKLFINILNLNMNIHNAILLHIYMQGSIYRYITRETMVKYVE